MNREFSTTQKIAMSALFAALAYISFQYLKIPIKLPGGDNTYFHLGNTFVVLGALMLGGVYGGLAGGIGLAIADLTSGLPIYAVTTLFLKLVMGLIAGLAAHRIGHINEKLEARKYMLWCAIAAVVSLGANIVLDPLVGFFRNRYLLQMEAHFSDITAKLTAGVTFVNAVLSVMAVCILYRVLRPALSKSGFFHGGKALHGQKS